MGAPRRFDDLTGLIHTDSMFVVINTVVFPVGRRRETGHEHIAAGEQALPMPSNGLRDERPGPAHVHVKFPRQQDIVRQCLGTLAGNAHNEPRTDFIAGPPQAL